MTGNSEQRRARGSRPTGRANGPGRAGRTTRTRATSTPASTPSRSSTPSRPSRPSTAGPAARSAAGSTGAPRSRFTGRAAVLVLVLAVLAVSYASSLRAYLQQRAHLDDLHSTISETGQENDQLEQELKSWKDPAFVKAEARRRLNYVAPGETPFVVLQDGVPLVPESELTDPASVPEEPPAAWWDGAWESVKVAGNPPRQTRPPLVRIEPEAESGE